MESSLPEVQLKRTPSEKQNKNNLIERMVIIEFILMRIGEINNLYFYILITFKSIELVLSNKHPVFLFRLT